MKRASLFAAVAILLSVPTARIQADESEVVKKRDWEGMVAIAKAAQKSGDTDLAKRKYFEAWSYARFWAVYDPADRDSGSKRADGIKGMEYIRTAAAGMGLDDTFRELDDIKTNPPKVFSGGKNNTGVWRDEENHIFTVKQEGGRVTGEHIDTEDELVVKFEGREFDGKTMKFESTLQVGKLPPIRITGTVSFDGNRITGKCKDEKGNPVELELIRSWRDK